jgi:hypothetical protein
MACTICTCRSTSYNLIFVGSMTGRWIGRAARGPLRPAPPDEFKHASFSAKKLIGSRRARAGTARGRKTKLFSVFLCASCVVCASLACAHSSEAIRGLGHALPRARPLASPRGS